MTQRATRTCFPRRRGAGLAAVILLLAVLNIAALGVLAAGADEADLSASRAQTVRAFYAAESGGVAVLKLTQINGTLPAAGATLNLGTATATYTQVPSAVTGGILKVTGESGLARRRIEVVFVVQ